MIINTGFINSKGEYEKHISFAKAVLWKDKQLSLRPDVIKEIRARGVSKLRFVDKEKGEVWVFNFYDVERNMKLKQVGQEEQFYFNIDLRNTEKL